MIDGLTDREAQALMWAAVGLSDRAIAECLAVTEKSVANRLSRCYKKLGIFGAPDWNPRVVAILKWIGHA